jgi:hypothetical protein
MKNINRDKIPNSVHQIIRENIKGFENALKMRIGPPQNAKESIDRLRSLLNADKWGLFEASELAEYFFALKSQARQFPIQFKTKLIIRECDEVLQFLDKHFDIVYFADAVMVSEKMEDFINEIKKQGGDV